MTTTLNFTQALAAQPWYIQTDESKALLKELDKDLKKWDAFVGEVTADYVSCCIDACFSGKQYRFILRIHAPIQIHAIDTGDIPIALSATHKLHLRTRSVLKNFLPVAFDRLRAQGQFELVSIEGPAPGVVTTSCVWATNTAGLGMTVVTSVAPQPLAPIQTKPRSDAEEPISMAPLLQTTAALAAYAQ